MSLYLRNAVCLWLAVLLCASVTTSQHVAAAQQQAASKIVVIVLDDSGSMKRAMGSDSRSRMEVAKLAIRQLIESLSDDTQLGIVLLNGAQKSNGWILPLDKLDRSRAIRTTSALRAEGGTPLGSVMQRAMNELLKCREKQPYGDYRLVVVTDGEATDAPVLNSNLPKLVSKGVVLDVIGVDMQSDHSLIQRSHSYRRANDAASFEQALKEIFAESSFDANAGDQEFELLDALPDGLAEQTLVAMREIGQGLPAKRDSEPSSGNGFSDNWASPSPSGSSSSAAAVVPQDQSHSNQARPAPEKRSFLSGKLFLVILVMFIIVLFKGLTQNIKRR